MTLIQQKLRERYDCVILGAGIFGLYAALLAAQKGMRTLVIEKKSAPFTMASYINQARIHKGYHYPRSFSTAQKTAEYQTKFINNFKFAVNQDFKKIYAIASDFSYTNAEEFEQFCARVGIRCDRIDERKYFNSGYIEAAYETEEYSYDAVKMCDYLMNEIQSTKFVDVLCDADVTTVGKENGLYSLTIKQHLDVHTVQTPFVINATYASINDVLDLFGERELPLKHELAEVVLCSVPKEMSNIGITVMDGPFFSIMPFGFTGLHSITAVSYTPHIASTQTLNDNACTEKSNFREMSQLSKKYLRDDWCLQYQKSLKSVKTTLIRTEVDDARPTAIIEHSALPKLTTVFSGKLTTIYDLELLFLNHSL
jgi:hypothetical protein